MIKTREQEYAATIYAQVEGVKNDDSLKKQDKEEYKNMSKKLPVLIRSAGLVQALYFAQTRNDGSRKLIDHLKQTLANPNLLDDARTKPISDYIHLTEKCLLALKWYKRFSEIHLEES
jgi:CRISPR-associated protein Cmr5